MSTTSYFLIKSRGVCDARSGPWYMHTVKLPSSVNFSISVFHCIRAMTGQMTNVPARAPPTPPPPPPPCVDRINFFGTLSSSISAVQSTFALSQSWSSSRRSFISFAVGGCFIPGCVCCSLGRWSRIVAIVWIVLPIPCIYYYITMAKEGLWEIEWEIMSCTVNHMNTHWSNKLYKQIKRR